MATLQFRNVYPVLPGHDLRCDAHTRMPKCKMQGLSRVLVGTHFDLKIQYGSEKDLKNSTPLKKKVSLVSPAAAVFYFYKSF